MFGQEKQTVMPIKKYIKSFSSYDENGYQTYTLQDKLNNKFIQLIVCLFRRILRIHNKDKVFFGAWLKLRDADETILRIRIVGSDELDLEKGWISIDSPMASSLLGRTIGDRVLVKRPLGDIEVEILEVSYDQYEE